MDAIEAILTRRSIRRYTKQSVSGEILRELLAAAMCAPSAGNRQPWCFVVINDREILDEIPKYHPYSQMLKTAPLAILVCCDSTLELKKFGVEDCSAATQNILLAAHAEGLGAVWLGLSVAREEMTVIKKLLNLPAHIVPISLVSIGYPADQKARRERYRADLVHYNRW